MTRIRLARRRKDGHSKGYAFMEFSCREVRAEARSMHQRESSQQSTEDHPGSRAGRRARTRRAARTASCTGCGEAPLRVHLDGTLCPRSTARTPGGQRKERSETHLWSSRPVARGNSGRRWRKSPRRPWTATASTVIRFCVSTSRRTKSAGASRGATSNKHARKCANRAIRKE